MYKNIDELAVPMRVGVTFESKRTVVTPPCYSLVVKYKGRDVGRCSAMKDPENSYYIFDFKIDEEFQKGNVLNEKKDEHFGFGSQLIEYVNEFLKSKHAIGKLVDGIDDPDKKGMYERHGWKKRVGSEYMYFQPKNYNPHL